MNTTLCSAPRGRSERRLLNMWTEFLWALSIPFENDFGETAFPGPLKPDIWLPREQVWLEIKSFDAEPLDPQLYKSFADETSYPLACIRGEPSPGRYRVFLQPPRHNRQLYAKITNAIFAEARKPDRRLWLLDDRGYVRLCKIWHIAQLKGPRPDPDSTWLAAAFECVRELDLNQAFDHE